MSDARVEHLVPTETVVLFIAGMLQVANKIAGTWSEPEDVAKKAWDIADAVWEEADSRYKENPDDETEGGGPRNPGLD